MRLGPYEILNHAGSGGMGEVYKARDTRLNRTVAIKVLPEDFSADADRRQRFEREARVVASLSHPNICALHDVGSESSTAGGPSRAYLVMEFLEGETLADRLVRGPLPLPDVVRYGADIATALDAAHRQHIVHRDLKPGNIMITRSGVKLLDFGLATAADPLFAASDAQSTRPLTNVTTPGAVMGTVPYMAPEQLEGRVADWRSDIFALGAVLHEMGTGKRAFTGPSSAAVASAILTSDPPPLTSSPPSIGSFASVSRGIRSVAGNPPTMSRCSSMRSAPVKTPECRSAPHGRHGRGVPAASSSARRVRSVGRMESGRGVSRRAAHRLWSAIG